MTSNDSSKNVRPCQKINAPTMAYLTVYGTYPDTPLRGRTNSPKKMWHGIDVDVDLEDEWLERLNSLPVEIKSTDQGKDETRVAFVIFRMPEGKDALCDEVTSRLKQESDVHVRCDIGNGGRPRICVANTTWKGKRGWKTWWQTLPDKIEHAVIDIL